MPMVPYLVGTKDTRRHFFEHIDGVLAGEQQAVDHLGLGVPIGSVRRTLHPSQGLRALVGVVDINVNAAISTMAQKNSVWVEATMLDVPNSGKNFDRDYGLASEVDC